MKFGQLIECIVRNIFLKKLRTKCCGETSARPFSELKVLHSLFLLYGKLTAIETYLKLSCRPLAFTSYLAFLKNKKRSGTSLLPLFST